MSGTGAAPQEARSRSAGGLSGPFVRRPTATMMLGIVLLLAGLLAYRQLPVSALPKIDQPTILVTAALPGADPVTMASAVATPLERQFGQIAGLTQMSSSSGTGVTGITLQFSPSRSIDSVAVDVEAALNSAAGDLPKTMPNPPTFRKTNPADAPVLILALTSDSLPLTTVDDYAESILVQKLSQLPGVGLVNILGQQQPAIRIELDPQRISSLGLTLDDVRTALGQITLDAAKGTLEGKQQAYAVETTDQIRTVQDFDDAIIAFRNGGPVRVRDVGAAQIGPANNQLAAWFGTQPAIGLSIQRLPGANVLATVDGIKQELPRLMASLPPAINIHVVSDRTLTIRASVADVQFTLMLTIALVVATILVFLRRIWATVIPAIAVPLSIVGTFGVMFVLGFSLDNLSLMALSIAVGFVVDDAIVMVENVVRHLDAGLSPLAAALQGAAEVGFTILSISISLMAVFIPLFLMGGIVGQLLHEFAVTVAVAIAMSAAVSLTLTPMLCALLLRRQPANAVPRGPAAWLERGFGIVEAAYGRMLDVVLRHQGVTLLTMAAIVALTGALFVVIPKGLFPQQDTGLLAGILEGAQDISIPALAERQKAVAALAMQDPAVATVSSNIGPGATNPAPNQGRMFISLKPKPQRGPDGTPDAIIARLNRTVQGVPGVRLYLQPSQDITIGGRVAKSLYQFSLSGLDQTALNQWAARVQDRMAQIPGLVQVGSDVEAAGPTLKLEIDRDAASRLGIQLEAIDDALDDAFGQRPATKVFTDLNQYFVILEVMPQFRRGPDALNAVFLRSASGQSVPLAQVAHLVTTTAPLVVNHQGQAPSVTLSFNLAPGVALGNAVDAVQAAVMALRLPTNIDSGFQGNARAYQVALAGQGVLILAALGAVYLILGMLYESWVHPLTIISTLPSAGLGALLALMAAGMPLDVIGIVGIVLLIGIVKKNGIMMVDFALQEQLTGKTPQEAIRQACVMRFRPILMTTCCAILGGVPLMLGTGSGAELRQPLGYAIVGGLLVSQVFTLFTTPVVFLAIDRLGQWRRRVNGQLPS